MAFAAKKPSTELKKWPEAKSGALNRRSGCRSCPCSSKVDMLGLMKALEYRLCFRCEAGLSCPVEVENIHPEWGKSRILNLIAAWRNQLIEVLGAMGIREIRRLRGEVGRAMFFDDLEKETFGKLFGKRKKRESVGN